MPASLSSSSSFTLKLLALHLFLIAAFFPNLFIGALTQFLPSIFHLFFNHNKPAPPPLPTSDTATTMSTSWFQKTFTLPPRSRGSYLITDYVLSQLPEIREYKVGMLNLFIQHTSCALSLNENWDEDVRADMSDALDRIAPADPKGNLYRHSAEGEDDMPVRLPSFCLRSDQEWVN